MKFSNGFGDRSIKDIVGEQPAIGEILQRHEIGCVTCGVGICHLKDVVAIHGLAPEVEKQIEEEINQCLESR